MRKKLGFTLAEVLITLGIIGVVAALTIPTLIHKFNNKALEIQYKKSVSVISQVIMKAKGDYGLDKLAYYCAYYPYPSDSGKPYDHAEECYKILYKTLLNIDGQKHYTSKNERYIERFNDNIRTYNNKQSITNNILAGIAAPVMQAYVMNDGSYINFSIIESLLLVGVDTNGAKKPNKLGHDIFIFQINKKSDAVAAATSKPQNLSEEEIEQGDYEHEYQKERAGNPCNLTSNQKGNGIGCAYYSLKDKCPYDNSKRYFECLP